MPPQREFKSNLDQKTYKKVSQIVRHVMTRCTSPDSPHWEFYGGRGVKVYEEWLNLSMSILRDSGA